MATAAGSTRTTFYQHFSSKAEVMSALLTKVDAILTTADDPPLTALVASGSRNQIQVAGPQVLAMGRDQAGSWGSYRRRSRRQSARRQVRIRRGRGQGRMP
ncbi:MAG: TetR/AcrR family transcriptional regulator [Rhodococcus sp. (in: high G+C Gram-positive bacteria)]|uniref:hypothetical protein n=1 Tax=Rhodococcus sp. TaxID=1831 RepID=UPI003BAFC067